MKRNILMVAFATALLLVGCGTKEKTPAPIQEYVDSLNAAYERGEDEAILSGSARVEDKTVMSCWTTIGTTIWTTKITTINPLRPCYH